MSFAIWPAMRPNSLGCCGPGFGVERGVDAAAVRARMDDRAEWNSDVRSRGDMART